MKILAIETASEACSAALLIKDENDNQQIYKQVELTPRQHAKQILSMLDKVLEEGDTALKDVDAIAFGRGPGAFTGLRIAAGVAQGVALSVDKPVVSVSTLAALAFQAIDETGEQYKDHILAAALDARMGEVYWGLFKWQQGQITPLNEEQVSKPEEMLQNTLEVIAESGNRHVLAIGAGWDAYQEELFSTGRPENLEYLETIFPTASAIAGLALPLFIKGKTVAPEDAQPVYIRNNVAKKSQKRP